MPILQLHRRVDLRDQPIEELREDGARDDHEVVLRLRELHLGSDFRKYQNISINV